MTKVSGRFLVLALGLMLVLWAAGAAGASPALAAQPAVPSVAGDPAPSSVDLDALVRQLEDPKARAELIARLQALRAAGGGEPARDAATEGAVEQVSRLLLERLDSTLRVFAALGEVLGNLPLLGEWLSYQIESEFRRRLWLNVLSGVAQALGIGGLVAWLVAWLARRYRPPGPLAGATRLRAAALDLLPATVFAGVSGLILDLGGFLPATARVAWLVVAAVLADRVLTVVTRHIAEAKGLPSAEAPSPPDTAGPLLRSARRICRLVIFGYTVLLVAGRLGLPPDLYDAASSVFVLLVATSLTVAILARRLALEQMMRALGRWIETDFLRRLLLVDVLIGTAHVWLVALVWLNAAMLVLGLGWGPVRATLATLAVLLAGHLLLTWLDRPAHAPREAGDGEEPGEAGPPAERLGTRLLKAGAKVGMVVILIEAWGFGLVSWLASAEGQEILRRAMRVALILGVCLLLWRLSAWWIGGYIAARDSQGNVRYSNRARTAAAIARSVIVVLLALIALTAVLSELGIQATPLLAGAGVVGLAVGFGSQKLVQDIINGLFILLGDTIRVGDVVDLGGRSGVVEAISMRTVTLRSYNGDVHTIPFGTIDSITNMTRDFSYAVLDLSVGYRENVDAVVAVLQEIESQMRREWPWRRLVLEPLEVAGLDRLADSGMVIRARLKTRPGEQWRVGRELNRRIKRRFDELGIEIPFPQRTIHVVGCLPGTPSAVASEQLKPTPPRLAAGGG